MLDLVKVASYFKASNEVYTTEPTATVREDGLVEVVVKISVVGKEEALGFRWLADLTGLSNTKAYAYFKVVGSDIMKEAIEVQLQA